MRSGERWHCAVLRYAFRMIEFRRPKGWPVVEPGLFMDHIGPVLVVYTDARCSDESFDRQVKELGRAIDERQWRVGVLYDVPHVRSLEAKRRKQIADMLHARREQLGKTTAAYALVTSSSIVRGMIRAVFWVAPPPYPYQVAATAREGMDYIASHMPGLRGDILAQEYATLLKTYSVITPLENRGTGT